MPLLNRWSNWWNVTCLTLIFFVVLLSSLVFVAAIVFEQQSPLAVAWGDAWIHLTQPFWSGDRWP